MCQWENRTKKPIPLPTAKQLSLPYPSLLLHGFSFIHCRFKYTPLRPFRAGGEED